MTSPIPGSDTLQVTVRPSRRLRTLYNLYLLIVVWCLVLPGLLILTIFIDPVTRIVIAMGALVVALAAIAMIRKSVDARSYILTETALEIRGGLGAGGHLRIPYEKIHSAEIVRRRLHSYLGIAVVRITYTTDSGKSAIADLKGIEHPEEVRSQILVRTGKEASSPVFTG
ncbi:MAG TPA: PH domain-containing protein [Methanoregulaceae archaeon]|nr:PH domain-containing protein [Methanoregulaceae archaeon]